MKRYNIYSFLLILLLIVSSCSDSATNTSPDPGEDQDPIEDQDPPQNEETTVEEDVENIELSLDKTLSLLKDMEEGAFVETLKTFLDASGGEARSEEWIEDVFSGLESFVDLESIEDNARFNFAAHTGIYEWSGSNESWSKTASTSEIVLKFPSSESSSSNDIVFTISEYSDVSTSVDGEVIYLPSRIKFDLERDGNALFGLDLKEVEYSNNDLPVPTVLNVEVFTAPVTYSLAFSRSSDANYSLSFEVSNEEELITGTSLNLELAHSDFSTLDEEDFEQLSGNINLTEDLSLDIEVELGTLLSIDDPSENQVNSLVTAEVSYMNIKIADLEYSEQEENLIIYYKDGSSEVVDRYYIDFLEELEVIFYSFTGDWSDF